jgi:predicted nucleotidyltransferase
MRITATQTEIITQCVHRHLGESARMWLFGSRLDDRKRGGDVDLYVETSPHTLMSELRCKVQ